MSKLTSVEQLRSFRDNCQKELGAQSTKILICAGMHLMKS